MNAPEHESVSGEARAAARKKSRRRTAGSPDLGVADLPQIAADVSRLLPASRSTPTPPVATPAADPEPGGFSFELPSFDLSDVSLGDFLSFDL